MNCNIILDLLPLYTDGCCSDETSEEIKRHLETCKECAKIYKQMSAPIPSTVQKSVAKKNNSISKINIWKASLLQSVLLFISFGLITIGVYFEASTPTGFSNGLFALNLVVPVTGFMLSLANWYFLRLYTTAKKFSFFSFISTLALISISSIWTMNHYEFSLSYFRFAIFGICLSIFLCILSAFSSYGFAKLSGKE